MKKESSATKLDNEIKRLTEALARTDPATKEYQIIAINLKAICESQKSNTANSLTPIIISAGTSILGTVLVLAWEHGHVIISKAFSTISKVRV